MNVSIYLTFLVIALASFTGSHAQDEDEGLLSRTFRGSSTGQTCEVQGQRGVCQRSTRCKRPTGKICRLSIIPVICCLNEPERKPVTKPPPPPPPPKPQRTTTKAPPPPEPSKPGGDYVDNNYVDIIFPGCGNRYPRSPTKKPATTNNRGGPLGGLFNRRLGRKKRGIFGPDPVIVGGVTAKPNSWPWMVAIFRKSSASPRFLCGASLISKRYVLSAAHCFPRGGKPDPGKYVVLVGAHNTKEGDGRWQDVKSILIHPDYVSGQYYNDMSLLELTEPIKLDDKVHPVCLPSPSLKSRMGNTKKNITVTGWGDTSFGGRASKVLQEVELPIVPLKECNSAYSSIAKTPFPRGIDSLFICAGLKEGGKDACQGDSGGPLIMQMDDSYYMQLGIVSFGYGCASPGFPGVYTRVSKFTRWIRDNTDLG